MAFIIEGTVPKEKYQYYIVVKKCKSFSIGKYDIGDRIICNEEDLAKRPKVYKEVIEEFLNNYCRKATEEESNKIYSEMFGNAIIQSYRRFSTIMETYHFYLPTENFKFEDEQKKNAFFKLTGIPSEDIYYFDLINGAKFIYREPCMFHSIFKVESCSYGKWRKATPEEALKCSETLCKLFQEEDDRIKEEIAREDEIRAERYLNHRGDPAYFPGSCGNFKQVLTDGDFKPIGEELYDLYAIKKFYEELIKSGKVPKTLLEKMRLYGGTVPYLLAGADEAPRKFGDVDIFMPIENMDLFREALKNKRYFKMTYDSKSLTEKAGLRADAPGRKFQDYGFKGKLFGINISVFPIYQWTNKGRVTEHPILDVCGKSFRLSEDANGNRYLLNTVVVHNTNISSFSKMVTLLGGTIGIVPLEYTIASKQRAIKQGFKKREDKDMADLSFIEENRKMLGIDDNLAHYYKENIPDYGIARVFRVTNGLKIDDIAPEDYKNLVTLHKHFMS